MKRHFLLGFLALPLLATAAKPHPDQLTTTQLAHYFSQPPLEYGPYVWWHWMGPNFSKEGIRKDLEAMKESGIAGATIFNLTSAVQESHRPVENNPWPEQTYRSSAYWEAIRYAAEQAERLGLKIGLHNSPGYSTTGGPWISEEQCMQKVVLSQTDVEGPGRVEVSLPRPEYPVFTDYSGRKRQATFYEDVAVMAVPDREGVLAADVVNLTQKTSSDGRLLWDAPEGKWHVFRIGHAPTMSTPHPLPDDIIGRALEADKLSAEVSAYHWDQVLQPLVSTVRPFIGRSFTHILVDSYEAGRQNWTDSFPERFRQMHGYDPLPLIALAQAQPDNPLSKKFEADRAATINRLFIEGSWLPAREKIHEAGLQMFWEPYSGPFSTQECIPIPDLPMSEFWTTGSGRIQASFIDRAREAGKNLIGAEAFTGWPDNSRYTEDPAFLKHSADGVFVSGINLLFLHHWVHQPFDDRYQPGMGMGWWGTHFGRNQTWFRPGRAFFTYLSRCQMMLRQGRLMEHSGNQLHRQLSESDIYFLVNQGQASVTESVRPFRKPVEAQLWDPYTGQISSIPSDTAFAIPLGPGQSVFLVLNQSASRYKAESLPTTSGRRFCRWLGDVCDVRFEPRLDEPFTLSDFRLADLSHADDERLRYFAGTATYEFSTRLTADDLRHRRVLISLGALHDIAELWVNGRQVATLWNPPYEADITRHMRKGENRIAVAVTNNWANRLIGDEQLEPDFEWGMDRGVARGRSIKGFPEWFVRNEPRPSQRRTFVIWNYYRKDSPLQPAGLIGPVELTFEETE